MTEKLSAKGDDSGKRKRRDVGDLWGWYSVVKYIQVVKASYTNIN